MPLYTAPGLLRPTAGAIEAPRIVGTGTAYFSSASLTSHSFSHTAPVDANCLALCLSACKASGAYNVTGLSSGGAPLATLENAAGWTFNRGGSATLIAALASPTPGAQTITVSFDVAPDSVALYALNLAGVDVASMVAASDGAAAIFFNVTALSLALPVDAPCLVFGGMALAQPAGGASFTPGPGIGALAQGTASGQAASAHFFGSRREGAPGEYAFDATASQASACSLVAVAFRGS